MHLVKSSSIQPLSNSAYIILYIKQSEILGEIRKIIWIFFILVCHNNKYRLSFSFTVVTALVIVCLVTLPLQIAMIVIGECKQTEELILCIRFENDHKAC